VISAESQLLSLIFAIPFYLLTNLAQAMPLTSASQWHVGAQIVHRTWPSQALCWWPWHSM